MAASPKYLLTEPPAVLTEPVSLTISDHALTELNEYRQAQHAWLSYTGDVDKSTRLRLEMERAGAYLAATLAAEIRLHLREPRHYAPENSAE